MAGGVAGSLEAPAAQQLLTVVGVEVSEGADLQPAAPVVVAAGHRAARAGVAVGEQVELLGRGWFRPGVYERGEPANVLRLAAGVVVVLPRVTAATGARVGVAGWPAAQARTVVVPTPAGSWGHRVAASSARLGILAGGQGSQVGWAS